jgi:hypothetical protein
LDQHETVRSKAIAQFDNNSGKSRRASLAVDHLSNWQCGCEAPHRDFDLSVRATDAAGNSDVETIRAAGGSYRAQRRKADGSDADTIGAWPENHIFGTQLGPNRNGKKW